jgi:hypothetical protein
VDGVADIGGVAAHFDRQADFTDQVAGVGADDAATDDAMRCFVEDQLGEALRATIGQGPPRRRPGEDALAVSDPFDPALLFGFADPGDFGIGVGDRGDLQGVETALATVRGFGGDDGGVEQDAIEAGVVLFPDIDARSAPGISTAPSIDAGHFEANDPGNLC